MITLRELTSKCAPEEGKTVLDGALDIKSGKHWTPENSLETIQANLDRLLRALNHFRMAYDRPMYVTSGYRSPEYNKGIRGARDSAHLYGLAADFSDPPDDRGFKNLASFFLTNLRLMQDIGLYAENPYKTSTWFHLTIRPPKSGARIFNP